MDWLRPLLLMFYAPTRGMALGRDRAPLGQAALLAVVTQSAVWAYGFWPVFRELFGPSLLVLLSVLISAAVMLILGAFFVPSVIFFANLFEKRGGFGHVLRQEYAATLSCVFYALSAVNLLGVVSVAVLKATGVSASVVEGYRESLRAAAEGHWITPELVNLFADPRLMPLALSYRFMQIGRAHV